MDMIVKVGCMDMMVKVGRGMDMIVKVGRGMDMIVKVGRGMDMIVKVGRGMDMIVKVGRGMDMMVKVGCMDMMVKLAVRIGPGYHYLRLNWYQLLVVFVAIVVAFSTAAVVVGIILHAASNDVDGEYAVDVMLFELSLVVTAAAAKVEEILLYELFLLLDPIFAGYSFYTEFQ